MAGLDKAEKGIIKSRHLTWLRMCVFDILICDIYVEDTPLNGDIIVVFYIVTFSLSSLI